MQAKANLFRTLLVLPVVLVAVVMALFGPGIGTAETQTTTSASTTTYYKVQDLGTLPGATYSPPTRAPYGINDLATWSGMRMLVLVLAIILAIMSTL